MTSCEEDRPPYTDRCPRCRLNPAAMPPMLVRENGKGTGVVADYICPVGHTWFTSWSWWTGVLHATDGWAA